MRDNNIYTKYLLCIFILLASFDLKAQRKNDVELWMGPKVEYGMNKRLRLDVEYQLRLDENVSKVKNSFNEFGLRIKLANFISVKPAFRLAYANPNDVTNRFTTDVALKLNKKGFPLRFTNRIRYQRNSTVNRELKTLTLRNKMSLQYNLSKKMDPTLSYELFWRDEGFANSRLMLKTSWRVNKRIDVDAFYALERELGESANDNVHIVGMMGIFHFKRKVRK